HNNAFGNGVTDSDKGIWPPLDCNEAFLALEWVRGVGPWCMYLEQDHVAPSELAGGGLNGGADRLSNKGRAAEEGIWRDTRNSVIVGVSTNYSRYCSAVVDETDIGTVGASNDSTLVHRQVFVGESPSPFTVDHPDTVSLPPTHCVGILC